ncbi:anaphase-promoting complex subunit 6-like [Andrographis paniculata]|uniref:anaphase-promoting complex subunit 6-like n=1 Tax=Andrographis paniculata TaxID=175694 RepID=UPI0021E7E0D9|nr:anaphase-promoting complex subunit 6-like [Andrographis paniculata]
MPPIAETATGSASLNSGENESSVVLLELEQEISDTETFGKSICSLTNNTDLLACKAEYYHQFDCLRRSISSKETVELGHSHELYLMAFNLVKDYPQRYLTEFGFIYRHAIFFS